MKVLVFVKATENSEAGGPPDPKMMEEMGRFNDQLIAAGIMKDCDGLKPSRAAKRVRRTGGRKTVVDGPFTETKELIAGYWIWEVKSLDEALEWALRCPDPTPGEDSELEIRPAYEFEEVV